MPISGKFPLAACVSSLAIWHLVTAFK